MAALSVTQEAPASQSASSGLTSEEARSRLEKSGPNAIRDTALHPLRRALTKFWAPVPWMLEATIVLEVVLGKYVQGSIIAALRGSTPVWDSFRKDAPRRRLPH